MIVKSLTSLSGLRKVFRSGLIKLMCFLVCAISFNAFAGETEYSLRRNKEFINTNSGPYQMEVTYPNFDGYGTYDELRHQGKLSLQYNREQQSDITTNNAWEYSIVFEVFEDGVWNTVPETLRISFIEGEYVYSDYHLFSTDAANEKKIRVTNVIGKYESPAGWVTVTNPANDSNIPADIHLELSIKTKRFYNLDVNKGTTVRFDNADKSVNWKFLQGAESYDLEWVFIDFDSREYQQIQGNIIEANLAAEDANTNFGDGYNALLPFKLKEPTRVNLKSTNYTMDWIYPQGLLYFRVRAVGRFTGEENPNKDYETLKNGNWNYYTTLGYSGEFGNEASISRVVITEAEAFNENQNWLYQSNFAENGKHVSSIGYYDGSLRGRQNAVYNTTDDITLVGESKYDYEGRPTISILPAPVHGKAFTYQDNFNLSSDGTSPFEKESFDNASPTTLYTQGSVQDKGASQYFSTNNKFTDDLFRESIPVADGYVYSQVKFNRDGTGRVSESAGIGEEFALNNGHTTKNFYGSANDVELRRLFGAEVGQSEFYRKNIVIDPNGQASSSYVDNHGRVIATALIGDSPDNLIALENTTSENLTTPLPTENVVDNEFEKTAITRQINLVSGATYSFSYDIDGVLYGVANPTDISDILCVECVYDLEFYITDPDGIEVPSSRQNYSFSADTPPVSCGGTGVNFYDPSNGNLTFGPFSFDKQGEYIIYKKLSLNEEATNANIYALVDDIIISEENFISSLLDAVSIIGCFDNCDDFCDYVGEALYVKDNPSSSIPWASLSAAVQLPYKVICNAKYCDVFGELVNGDAEDQEDIAEGNLTPEDIGSGALCKGVLAQINTQISPNGIFYEEEATSDYWTAVADDLSEGTLVLHTAYNEDGTAELNATVITDVTYLRDNTNFKEEWLVELYKYHREACHYDVCVTLRDDVVDPVSGMNSLDFDATLSFSLTKDYQDWTTFYGSTNPESYWLSTSTGGAVDPINNITNNPIYNALSKSFYEEIESGVTDCDNTKNRLEETVDNCVTSTGADGLSLYTGRYLSEKDSYIGKYKKELDKLNYGSDAGAYAQGCLFYDDDDNIIEPPIEEEDMDKDGDGTVSANELENWMNDFNQNLGSKSGNSFNCTATCENKVSYWMNTYASECIPSLTSNQVNELENLFGDYCMNSCADGNSGGWFYNNGTPEYTAVVNFFNLHTSCNIDKIEIDANDISISTTQFNSVSPCLQKMVSLFNELYWNAADGGTHSSVNINTSDPNFEELLNCKLVGGLDIARDQGTVTTQNFQDACPDGLVIRLSIPDFQGTSNYHTLFGVIGVYNLVASQTNLNVVYCDVSFDDGIIRNGVLEVGTCFQNIPINTHTYNPAVKSWSEDCIDAAFTEAYDLAKEAYEKLRSEKFNEMEDIVECMRPVVEKYTMTYELKEHQYTLFYYDQVGNLRAAVPPEGVEPLAFNATNFNTTTGEWNGINPNHGLESTYTYNGLNELISQNTPDGGTSNFYYDDLYRLRFSQNEKQVVEKNVSYTLYDELGRITEAGEAGGPGFSALNLVSELNNYDFPSQPLKRDYVKTYYEQGVNNTGLTNTFSNGQQNLNNRIGAIEKRTADYKNLFGVEGLEPVPGTEVIAITSYSYDFHGNVKELVQTNSHLNLIGHEHKKIEYTYDLISGNVNEVAYQTGKIDEWRHHYDYDANNRLVRVFTSDDAEEWEMDTKYFYNLHGAMARVEKGHDKIQGCDYAYTLNGWLKGVNSTTLKTENDLGKDGDASGLNKYSGSDAAGFSLGYFAGDYENIGSRNYFANTVTLINENGTNGNLYNGNISHMVTAMKNTEEAPIQVLGNNYKYDQLQRIKSMDVFSVSSQSAFTFNNSFAGATNHENGAYATTYSYDKNGNLSTLTRNDNLGETMDNFSYSYNMDPSNNVEKQNNRLRSVADNASNTSLVETDIKAGQIADNYEYDAIGQLTKDDQEKISEIQWTVTGKVRRMKFSNGKPDIEFVYDAMGMRIMKIVGNLEYANSTYTYYVYDASGNVMSTYERTIELDATATGCTDCTTDKLTLNERMIYGSKRVAVKREDKAIASTSLPSGYFPNYPKLDINSGAGIIKDDYDPNKDKTKRQVGRKYFEVTNHLGNVLEVITDRKLSNADLLAYEADIISYSDYYPFGMTLPGRSGGTNDYRYGFQGSEKDDEIKGEGNSYTTYFRRLDSRIGRWLSIDPKATARETPYASMGNNPILNNDILGDKFDPSNIYEKNSDDSYKNETEIKAFEIWASSKEGRRFILDHAEKGYELKGVFIESLDIKAKSDGRAHRKGVDVDFKSVPAEVSRAGTTMYGNPIRLVSYNAEMAARHTFENERLKLTIEFVSTSNRGEAFITPSRILGQVKNFNHELLYHGDYSSKLFQSGVLNKQSWIDNYSKQEYNHQRGWSGTSFYDVTGRNAMTYSINFITSLTVNSSLFDNTSTYSNAPMSRPVLEMSFGMGKLGRQLNWMRKYPILTQSRDDAVEGSLNNIMTVDYYLKYGIKK